MELERKASKNGKNYQDECGTKHKPNPGMVTADGGGLLRGQTNWYMMYLQSLGLIPRSI